MRSCQLSFVVVDDPNTLIKIINDLTVDNQMKMKILKRNEEIFNGTGLIKYFECHIKVDKSVAPVIRPPRRVLLAIRDRLQEKLNLLEREKIIEKVDCLVTWLSNLVVIAKLDGGLRICLDPTDLNKAIIKTPALVATLQEVLNKVLERARFNYLKFNPIKFQYKTNKVRFLGF